MPYILDPNGNFQQFYGPGGAHVGQIPPTWKAIIGQFTKDGGAQWLNSNGNLQVATAPGTSGATAPTWSAVLGNTTVDNTIVWTNQGSATVLTTGNYQYSYSTHSVTGHVSPTSTSLYIGPLMGVSALPTFVLTGSAAGAVDQLWLWRTAQGGTTLLFDTQVANPGASTVNISDTNLDSALSVTTQAPLALINNAPPTGLINLTYHLSRLFGSVGNSVYYSNPPLASTGVNTEQFPPANVFVVPSLVLHLLPTTIGLLVFTQSDVYLIGGQGTSSAPLFSVPFLIGIGLNSYNALDVNGSTIYLMTSQKQTIALDPSSGVSEVGFPIGDTLETTFNPANSYLTWHAGGSRDKALFVADGSTGWYRMSPTPTPESGISWSPLATITGGCKAVQSIETSPGIHQLLVGPATSGPILKRDLTVSRDNGTPFDANAIIGSIVLAHPGQVAEIRFIATDCEPVGSRPQVSVLMDEIAGNFDALPNRQPDPPILPPSVTIYGDRYWMSSAAKSAFCRHMQIQFAWPIENAANELLSYTINGAIHNLD